MTNTAEAGGVGVLDGVRVLEAATMLAAPLTGTFLGDHGAEVVKVEMPETGDQMRGWGHQKDGQGLFWKVISRNKRLVTLDLRSDEGRDAFLRLVADSDVLIENFRPGTLDRWGIDAEALRKARPDLIVLRVTGYGQIGPNASRPGFGTLAEAMSGFAAMNGWADSPPTLPPFGLADAITGLTGAFGVLGALRHRDRTGEGQEIDLALYDGLLTLLGSIIIDYDQAGIVPGRLGNVTPFSAPRGVYPTSDGGWLAISASSHSTAHRLFRAIGHPEFVEDPRFADNRSRVANAKVCDDAIEEWSRRHTLAEALAEMGRLDVPAVDVKDVAAIVDDEHLHARGSLVEVEDPELGTLLMQAPIPRFERTPGSIRFVGGELGADNDRILGDVQPTATGGEEVK